PTLFFLLNSFKPSFTRLLFSSSKGITSATVLLVSYLQRENNNISYYIPDRFTEGYSLSNKAVDYILDNKFDLVITVDCGISNFTEIEKIKKNSNCSIIVMDHHTIPEQIPEVDAVFNPKLLSSAAPIYNLCAAGVVYKFLEYYCKTYDEAYDCSKQLDLVAIATVAVIPSAS
ncbi:DHH family phosphoesterase, partial [Candidatus Margulisiibacteriota bacterium]